MANEAYLDECRSLLRDLEGYLSLSEIAEVAHFIDHDEPAEGLRTLAGVIVEENKRVPRTATDRLYDLIDGFYSREDLPDLGPYSIASERT